MECSSDSESSMGDDTALTERVMAMPYQFEPTLSPRVFNFQPDDGNGDEVRRRDTSWCSCGSCVIMEKAVECICCTEFDAVLAKIMLSQKCVTENEEFRTYCLTPFILEVEYEKLKHYHPRFNNVASSNARYRYTAYRQFVWWAYRRLGAGNRVVLPSCVVKTIRKAFPSPSYTGFQWY